MAGRFAVLVATCLAVLVSMAPAQSAEKEDILALLKARDDSITSFEIKWRRVYLELKLEDAEAIEQAVKAVADRTDFTDDQARAWAEDLVQKWSEKRRWMTEHVHQRGRYFKQTRTSNNGKYVDIEAYDGRLHYDYPKINRQLDIHPKIPNVAHADLATLGLSMKWLYRDPNLITIERNVEGARYVLTMAGDPESQTSFEFDSDLCLRNSRDHLRAGAVAPNRHSG